MRYDLLPSIYCEELSTLLDKLPPISFSVSKRIIENELGSIDKIFSTFNKKPIASASIAQVYDAILFTGEQVVVKIVKPWNKQIFKIDLLYIQLLGKLITWTGILKKVNISYFIQDFIKMTLEEFDFKREASNIQFMHECMLKDDIAHYAPKVYSNLCSDSIITMEKIVGVPVNKILLELKNNNLETLEQWRKKGISPERTSRILIRSVLEQFFRHKFFHADPHAANLFVMDNGTLAWVDFGMTGRVSERLLKSQFKLRIAILNKEMDQAYQYFVESIKPLPLRDLTSFENQIKESMWDWVIAAENPNASIVEKSSGYFFLKLFEAVRKEGLHMSFELVRFYRALIVSDMVMLKLDPQINWLFVVKEFIFDEQKRHAYNTIKHFYNPINLFSNLQLINDLPRSVSVLSNWISEALPQIKQPYEKISMLKIIFLTLLRMLQLGLVLVIGYLALTIMFNFQFMSWTNQIIEGHWSKSTIILVFVFVFSFLQVLKIELKHNF